MLKVTSRALAAFVTCAALAACGTDSPTAPTPGAPELPLAPPTPALVSQQTQDMALLASTNIPDAIDVQGSGTLRLSLTATAAAHPLDLMVLMDASGSLGATAWSQEQAFVNTIIDDLIPTTNGHHVGIIEFSTTTSVEWSLADTQSPALITAQVSNLPYLKGYTHTRDAVSAAALEFDTHGTPGHRRLILLLTDGIPNPETQTPCPLAPYLHANDEKVVVVGVGADIQASYVDCLLDSDQDFIPVDSFDPSDLANIQDQIGAYLTTEIDDVQVTGTVASGFDVSAGPTEDDPLPDGTPSSSFDPNTRQLTWTLPGVSAERGLTLDVTPRMDVSPVCGPRDVLTNVQVTYTNQNGESKSESLPDVVTEVTGCVVPTITPTVDGTAGDNGWYTSDVSVSWDVQSPDPATTDQCDPSTVSDDTAGFTFTCSATSVVGTASESVTVKRDATPPVVTFSGNAGAYSYGQQIQITCSATDATSGIASSTCADVDVPADSYSEGTHTLSATATDNAGNSATVTTSFTVTQDHTPPVITPTVSGTLGSGGWYVSDVSVSFAVEDAESAVSGSTGCDATTVTSDTEGVTFTCEATSAGGTDAQSVTVKRDATDPSLAYAGNAGTYSAAEMVSITCSASDATSGLASTDCADVDGAAWSFGVGSHTFSASAADNAGNTSTASATFTVTVSASDLDVLIDAWVTGPGAQGVANSLKAKLHGKKANVQAFVNEVNAQSGKKIDADKAAILIALANAL